MNINMAIPLASRALMNCVKATSVQSLKSILCVGPCVQYQPSRNTIQKHWNPKFRRLRQAKLIKIDLPNFDEARKGLTKDLYRAKMKERGLLPPRPWTEKPMFIASTGGVFEPYIPPEGDGKLSAVSVGGAKQKLELLSKKSKSMMAVRKIRSFEEEFNLHEFAEHAKSVYISAHEAMANKDEDKLIEFVTESAYPEIRHNTEFKTIKWKYLESLEPPRVVHARVTDVISKDNLFAQVTVRFHSQQSLAIYDRFGRLEHGSPDSFRDVLEYIVFEKNISNMYGVWRLHSKIIPDWMPSVEPAKRTFVLQPEEPQEEIIDSPEEKKQEEEEETKAAAGGEGGNLAKF